MRLLVCLAIFLPTVAQADWDELKKLYRADSGMAEMQRWEALRNQEQIVCEMRRMNKNLERLAEEREDHRGWPHERFGYWEGPLGGAHYTFDDEYEGVGDDWGE